MSTQKNFAAVPPIVFENLWNYRCNSNAILCNHGDPGAKCMGATFDRYAISYIQTIVRGIIGPDGQKGSGKACFHSPC